MNVLFSSVDRLLNPANRAHMCLEEQLKELLEKLDLTCAMKTSPSRSKRLKLLKKEICNVRAEISLRNAPPARVEEREEPGEREEPRPEEAEPAGQGTEDDGTQANTLTEG